MPMWNSQRKKSPSLCVCVCVADARAFMWTVPISAIIVDCPPTPWLTFQSINTHGYRQKPRLRSWYFGALSPGSGSLLSESRCAGCLSITIKSLRAPVVSDVYPGSVANKGCPKIDDGTLLIQKAQAQMKDEVITLDMDVKIRVASQITLKKHTHTHTSRFMTKKIN